MKILLSSTTLANKLKEFDFKSDSIWAVRCEDGKMYLDSNVKTVVISCEILEFKARIKQDNRRWDFIKDLVTNVNEQPIVLNITEDLVNVIFSY